jgi:hypothetical protein
VSAFLNEEEINMTQQIGEAAGRVWKYLSEHPDVHLEHLSKDLKLKDTLVFMATGWLAREGKLAFEEDGKTTKISLVAE